jgi:hypothetical protein
LKLSSPPPAYWNPWEIRVNFKFKFSSPSIYQDPLKKKKKKPQFSLPRNYRTPPNMNMATITLKKERIMEDQLAQALFMIIND